MVIEKLKPDKFVVILKYLQIQKFTLSVESSKSNSFEPKRKAGFRIHPS